MVIIDQINSLRLST